MQRPIYTARVTQIEAFRMFLYGQTEENQAWINEPNVIATLKGEQSVNIKADYGTAGHAIIEFPKRNRTNTGYQVDDFVFTHKQVQPLLKYCQEHPLMVREVPVSKLYHCRDFDIIITGTVDALEGLHIRDNKFKFSSFDMQGYLDSVQHRFYLDIVNAEHFYYDFFRVKGFDKIEDCGKAVIEDCESLYIRAHQGMVDELQSILNDFADWITFKGLAKYLQITPVKYIKIIRGDSSLKKFVSL